MFTPAQLEQMKQQEQHDMKRNLQLRRRLGMDEMGRRATLLQRTAASWLLIIVMMLLLLLNACAAHQASKGAGKLLREGMRLQPVPVIVFGIDQP